MRGAGGRGLGRVDAAVHVLGGLQDGVASAGERLLALDYRDPVDPGRLLLPWLSRPGEP